MTRKTYSFFAALIGKEKLAELKNSADHLANGGVELHDAFESAVQSTYEQPGIDENLMRDVAFYPMIVEGARRLGIDSDLVKMNFIRIAFHLAYEQIRPGERLPKIELAQALQAAAFLGDMQPGFRRFLTNAGKRAYERAYKRGSTKGDVLAGMHAILEPKLSIDEFAAATPALCGVLLSANMNEAEATALFVQSATEIAFHLATGTLLL